MIKWKFLNLGAFLVLGTIVFVSREAAAEVVISNIPGAGQVVSDGGSVLGTSPQNVIRALVFTTGSNFANINSITLGLNPATCPSQLTCQLPSSPSIAISLFSIKNGQPFQSLFATGFKTVSITSLAQLYRFTFSSSQLTLQPNTQYAFLFSSNTAGIKLANNKLVNNDIGPSPVGSNGFTFNNYLSSVNGDPFFENPTQNNIVSIEAILFNPQVYAANQSVGLNALGRQRDLIFAQAGTRRGLGFSFGGSSVAEEKKPKEELLASASTETVTDIKLVAAAGKLSTADKQPEEKPFFFWASVGNSNANIFGNGTDLAGYSSGIFNSLYGIENKINPNWTVGAVFGYGTTNLNSSDFAASIGSSNYSGNIYGVYKNDSWRVAAALGYTRFNLNGSRTDLFNLQQASASYNADGYSAGIQASYDIYPGEKGENAFRISPLLGLAWDAINTDSFNETGAGTQNLAVQGSASNSLVSTLGVGVTAPIQLEQKDQTLIPRMSVSWRHDYLAANPATTSVTAGLVSFPEVGTVTAQGQNLGPDSLNLTASLELQMGRNVSLYGGADYQVATNSTQFGYSGGVRVKF